MTNSHYHQIYKSEKSKYQKYISEYKKSYNNNKILKSKNMSKSVWSIINSETNRKYCPPDDINLINEDDSSVTDDPRTIPNLFAKHFNYTTQLHNAELNAVSNSIYLSLVDCNEIFSLIMSLPNKLSSGLDEVPIIILKHIAGMICKPVSHIINEVFATRIIPSKLKKSKVIHVYKKGDKQDLKNYRPISLIFDI